MLTVYAMLQCNAADLLTVYSEIFLHLSIFLNFNLGFIAQVLKVCRTQVLQPAKDFKFRTVCLKNFRQEKKSIMHQDSYFTRHTVVVMLSIPNHI